MNRFNFWALAIAVIACSSAVYAGYSAPSSYSADGASGDGAAADSAAASHAGDAPSHYGSGGSYGSSNNIPYAPGNTKGNTVTSSITYPQNKGEILIHRPAAIIVKRPPTKVLVNHPPLVVKPAPVVLHKPPAIVMRKVYVKHHPRPVKVEPVYVNVVKPPAEKYFVNEKTQQHYGGQQLKPVSYGHGYNPVPATAVAAGEKDGYQLLSGKDGLAALGGIYGGAYEQPQAAPAYAPHQPAYNKYEPKYEQKYESKYDSSYDSKYDGKYEAKYEPKYEPKYEGKYESKYEPAYQQAAYPQQPAY